MVEETQTHVGSWSVVGRWWSTLLTNEIYATLDTGGPFGVSAGFGQN